MSAHQGFEPPFDEVGYLRSLPAQFRDDADWITRLVNRESGMTSSEVRWMLKQKKAAQTRLTNAICDEHGWTRYKPGSLGIGMLGRSHWRHCPDTAPHADHGGAFYRVNRVVALVEQPYTWHGPERVEDDLRRWAAKRDVEVHKPDAPSWHWPGRTTLYLIVRPGVLDVATRL